ncbi:hypothetical protein DSN97_00190 [Deferribacteraceae bacterium V6Fe1]|nr:hypothetical protein DSN97_00190 [Deferribacteraceae bacterium V6Fe1]
MKLNKYSVVFVMLCATLFYAIAANEISKTIIIFNLTTITVISLIVISEDRKTKNSNLAKFIGYLKIPIVVHNQNGDIILTNDTAKSVIDEKNINELINNKSNEAQSQKIVIIKTQKGLKKFNIDTVAIEKDKSLSYFTDISELNELKKQIYMAQNQAAIGLLTSGLSHDFKNILQNINIYLSLIKQSKNYEDIAAYCNTIKQLVDDSNSFIKSILDLSKNQNKEFEKINLNNFLKETMSIIEKTSTVKTTISYMNFATEVNITTIPSMLRQILINLSQNALEALKDSESGLISITVEKISIKLIDFIRIDLKDNGKGIKKEDLDKIFSPFYTTNKISGTGLGLTMAKILIKELGGFIEADSKIGEWTCFSIYLPIR